MAAVPDGFEVPVCQALLRPRLTWGAPREVSLVTMAGAGMAVIWSWWSAFPVLVVVQGLAMVATLLDEDWTHIVLRVLRSKRHYSA